MLRDLLHDSQDFYILRLKPLHKCCKREAETALVLKNSVFGAKFTPGIEMQLLLMDCQRLKLQTETKIQHRALHAHGASEGVQLDMDAYCLAQLAPMRMLCYGTLLES